LFITVCFAPLIEGGTTYIPVLVLNLLVAASVLLHVERWSRGLSPLYVRSTLDIPALLFIAAAVFSVFVAPYKYMAMTWLRLIVMYALFFAVARASMRGTGSLMPAVIVIMSMGLLETSVSVAQWVMGIDRVKGTFFNPNMAAGYIAVSVIFGVSLLVNRDGRVRGPAARWALAAFCAAGIAAIVLSGSRGALAAFAAGLLVVLWLRYRFVAVGVVLAMAVLTVVVPNPVRDRLFSKEPFAYSRAGIWSASISMAEDHPAGVGLGNFKYVYPRYAFPVEDTFIRYEKKARTAHNEYLHFTAEMGIPGIVAMLVLLFSLVRGLYSSVRMPVRPGEHAVAAGVLGGVISVLSHSLVDSNLHEPGTVFMFIFIVCIGLEAGAAHAGRVVGNNPPPDSLRRLRIMGLVLAVAMAVWAAMPEAARHFMERGKDSLKQGELVSALKDVNTALMFEPGNAAYHEQKASVLYALYGETKDDGRLADALDELEEAESLNPNLAHYPSMAAEIKMAVAPTLLDPSARRTLIESSAQDVGRALESEPFSAELLYRLAVLDYSLGDVAGAERALVRARELEPNFLKGRYMLAVIYSRTGRERLSKEECYSIIGIHEKLSKRRLGMVEAEFAAVDIGGVNSLLESMGDQVH